MARFNHSRAGRAGQGGGHSGMLESWKTVAGDTIASAAGESFTGFLGQFPVATLVWAGRKGHRHGQLKEA